ncbi:hypothetical protein C4E44_28225 [Pseudomonas sp. MWU12-2312b]|nr:hypothetical protein C4E44_28225 [Pseudomonas sp. MWU12-2312b]
MVCQSTPGWLTHHREQARSHKGVRLTRRHSVYSFSFFARYAHVVPDTFEPLDYPLPGADADPRQLPDHHLVRRCH